MGDVDVKIPSDIVDAIAVHAIKQMRELELMTIKSATRQDNSATDQNICDAAKVVAACEVLLDYMGEGV